MRTQFTSNVERGRRMKSAISIVFFFCTMFLGAFVANAQNPVGAEFRGNWSLDRAEIKERPLNSNQSYSVKTLTKSEVVQKSHFSGLPTQIEFVDEFLTFVTTSRFGSSEMFAVINATDDSTIEFKESRGRKDLENIIEFPTTSSYLNLKLNGNTMSFQYNYVYRSGSGENDYTEGIITLYYKR